MKNNGHEVKVSVIVAIYNVDKFLNKCISSIINQDYKNIEIILVDDNSSDDSGKICDSYAAKDARITVIHHGKNLRQSVVRNDGMKAATGDYVTFVDGDDWLAKDYVSYMLSLVENGNMDYGINLDLYTTRDTRNTPGKDIIIWTPEEATYALLWPTIVIGAWNKIYKRKFLIEHNIRFVEDLFCGEGLRFITDVSQRVESVAVGNKRVYHYRLNNTESATTKYDVKQSLNAIKAVEGIEKDLIIRTKKVLDAAERHAWRNHLWNIRQIVATKAKSQYKKEYRESKKYIRETMYDVMGMRKNIGWKIKVFLSSVFPVTVSRIKIYKDRKNLQRDYDIS